MEYTVILTKKPNAPWQAVVPALPSCAAEAATREEVLAQIRAELTQSQIEVVKLDVPLNGTAAQPSLNGSGYTTFEQEWPDYAKFKDDPTWDAIFDEIERERERYRVGE